MAADINMVALVGRLTRDPEMRSLPSGSSVCELRIAVNGLQKNGESYEDRPNFFNVTVFGRSGENVAKYCGQGDRIAVNGRLEWREWDGDNGKREAVKVIANSVQFLQTKGESSGSGSQRSSAPAATDEDVPF